MGRGDKKQKKEKFLKVHLVNQGQQQRMPNPLQQKRLKKSLQNKF